MAYRNGPRAQRLFSWLEAAPLPRMRCPHLADNASHSPRLLASWNPDAVTCPTCAGAARERALSEGIDCPACHEPTTALLTFSRVGAITVVAGLCPSCAGREEVDLQNGTSTTLPDSYQPATHTPAWSSK